MYAEDAIKCIDAALAEFSNLTSHEKSSQFPSTLRTWTVEGRYTLSVARHPSTRRRFTYFMAEQGLAGYKSWIEDEHRVIFKTPKVMITDQADNYKRGVMLLVDQEASGSIVEEV